MLRTSRPGHRRITRRMKDIDNQKRTTRPKDAKCFPGRSASLGSGRYVVESGRGDHHVEGVIREGRSRGIPGVELNTRCDARRPCVSRGHARRIAAEVAAAPQVDADHMPARHKPGRRDGCQPTVAPDVQNSLIAPPGVPIEKHVNHAAFADGLTGQASRCHYRPQSGNGISGFSVRPLPSGTASATR